MFKKLNLKTVLANPLAMPIKNLDNTKRASYLYFHTLLFLGIGCGIGSYIAGEIRRYELYDKYKREVSFYIRWKMEQEIKKCL